MRKPLQPQRHTKTVGEPAVTPSMSTFDLSDGAWKQVSAWWWL